MAKLLNSFCNDESGATAIEYALIAAIIGLGLVAGLGDLATAIDGFFNDVSENF